MPLLNEADAVYLGDGAVDAVYLGDALVWPQPDFTAVLETMAEDGKTAFHVDGTFLPGPHTVLLTDPNGLADSIADTDDMEIVGTVVPADAFGGVILLSPNTWSHYKPLVGQVITVEGSTQPVGDQTVYTVKVPPLLCETFAEDGFHYRLEDHLVGKGTAMRATDHTIHFARTDIDGKDLAAAYSALSAVGTDRGVRITAWLADGTEVYNENPAGDLDGFDMTGEYVSLRIVQSAEAGPGMGSGDCITVRIADD